MTHINKDIFIFCEVAETSVVLFTTGTKVSLFTFKLNDTKNEYSGISE